jgi:hypothetical protein
MVWIIMLKKLMSAKAREVNLICLFDLFKIVPREKSSFGHVDGKFYDENKWIAFYEFL